MRILVHDFGGYPFPAQLSRTLAGRGHEVFHAYCPTLATTPGGEFCLRENDPTTLSFEPIDIGEPIAKFSFVKRFFQERRYGVLAAKLTKELAPDVVLSANMPLDAQTAIQRRCRQSDIAFVFWLQDVLGVAADRLLRRKIPFVGGVVGRHYLALEGRLLRRSDAVVPITDDFRDRLIQWGVDDDAIVTVENWAPLGDMPVLKKDNSWAVKHCLADKFAFVYSGTMGMKHNPELIAQLARQTKDRSEVRVVVVSQGPAADYLRELAIRESLQNLLVCDFVPLDQLPNVFGSADVLMAVLEPEAGEFSVPSKVLAYLCTGKPLLTAMPETNLAARIVTGRGAGISVAPDDLDGFVNGGKRLLNDSNLRQRMGLAARQYAEEFFDIEAIADRFEMIVAKAQQRKA